MCGIVGMVGCPDVASTLVQALQRLEYRGYDSAGLAILDKKKQLRNLRVVGKVAQLSDALAQQSNFDGQVGIAHTRWATHGPPTPENAHPHVSGGRHSCLALVHNGIVENHADIRDKLQAAGYRFSSDTDTEVLVHLIDSYCRDGMKPVDVMGRIMREMKGSYTLAFLYRDQPNSLYAICRGSPLVLGLGDKCCYLASDMVALLPLTRRFIFLHDGDIAEIGPGTWNIRDAEGHPVQRPEHVSDLHTGMVDRGDYTHFMLKEIHEQPDILRRLIGEAVQDDDVEYGFFGAQAASMLPAVRSVQFVSCGSSHHSAMIGAWWIESIAGIPCRVDVASEFRHKPTMVTPDCLLVAVSQSGETADTLSAVHLTKDLPYLARLSVCNMANSSLVRETELVCLTQAGPEISVASTKTFTAQLTVFFLLALALHRAGGGPADKRREWLAALSDVPEQMKSVLEMSPLIDKEIATPLSESELVFYLGRGLLLPVALEGALKIKEIAYLCAEAHPAGELKHGPLALVERDTPVVVLQEEGDLGRKMLASLAEAQARGGRPFIFSSAREKSAAGPQSIHLPSTIAELVPFTHTLAMQLLAYYVARHRGSDIDQPRNLAKSVTVE